MSHTYNPKNKATLTTSNSGYAYANVTIASPSVTGISYATGASTQWVAGASGSFYQTQPKVKITDSDIEIDGLSLKATLQAINERMAVMIPNPALEREFEELRVCADRYRELEQKFLEQKAMWETLKKQD